MTRKSLISTISVENPFISNQDLVSKVLISEILSRTLKCGDHLSQNKLSTEFNLSRGPIKQALEKLERIGYLTHDEAGSFYVNNPGLRFRANILSFKRQLDLLAVNQAVYDISKEQLELLHKNLNSMISAYQKKEFVEFCHCDLRFHQVIVESAHNVPLKETYAHYQNLFLFTSLSSEMDDRIFRRLLHQHQKIFNALSKRQSEALQSAIDAHYSTLTLL